MATSGMIFQSIWKQLLSRGVFPSLGMVAQGTLQLLDSAIESTAYFFIGGRLAKYVDNLVEKRLQIPVIFGSKVGSSLLQVTLHLVLMYMIIIFSRTLVEMIPTPLSGQVGPSMGSVLLVWVIMLQSPGLVKNVKQLLHIEEMDTSFGASYSAD